MLETVQTLLFQISYDMIWELRLKLLQSHKQLQQPIIISLIHFSAFLRFLHFIQVSDLICQLA